MIQRNEVLSVGAKLQKFIDHANLIIVCTRRSDFGGVADGKGVFASVEIRWRDSGLYCGCRVMICTVGGGYVVEQLSDPHNGDQQ